MKLLKLLAQKKEDAEKKQQEILDAIDNRESDASIEETLELARLYREILDCDHSIKEIMDGL